jgi:hypothetical protein
MFALTFMGDFIYKQIYPATQPTDNKPHEYQRFTENAVTPNVDPSTLDLARVDSNIDTAKVELSHAESTGLGPMVVNVLYCMG